MFQAHPVSQSVILPVAIAALALGLSAAGEAHGQTAEITGSLVVVNKRASTATIVDVGSNETLATLSTGHGPHEVAITKDGRLAVVTDYGGVLSHTAVVAREYRIPAVVGTNNATSTFKDGQLIEVDGNTGIVRVVVEEHEHEPVMAG